MGDGRPIQVVIADKLALVRQGLRVLLTAIGAVEVVGEAATGDDAVWLVRQLKPNVVLMDQDLPPDSLAATRTIKEAVPDTEVIIMTGRLDDVKALEAIKAGATAYLFKDIPVANLAAALRAVANGRALFHPEVTRKLVERLGHLRDQRGRLRREVGGLTARELDIVLELAQGSTDREIAAKLSVTEGTVKTHIRHILHKLGARNRTQAVADVLRRGLIA